MYREFVTVGKNIPWSRSLSGSLFHRRPCLPFTATLYPGPKPSLNIMKDSTSRQTPSRSHSKRILIHCANRFGMGALQPLDSTFVVLPFIQTPRPSFLQYTVTRIHVRRLSCESALRNANAFFVLKSLQTSPY